MKSFILLRYTILYYISLNYVIVHHIVLCYIMLYYVILIYIRLYCSVMLDCLKVLYHYCLLYNFFVFIYRYFHFCFCFCSIFVYSFLFYCLFFPFRLVSCVVFVIVSCICVIFFIIIIIFLLDLFRRNLRAKISSFILFFSRIYKKTGFKFYFTNLYYFITNIWLSLLFHFYPIFLFVASKLEENEPWTTPKHYALVHIIVLTS